MKKKPLATRRGPAKGSPRVMSWIYGVINPLVDALEVERRFLARGRLTFGTKIRSPFRIRPPLEYLLPEQRTVYADLARARPSAMKGVDHHGQLIAGLRDAALATTRSLLGNPRFTSIVREGGPKPSGLWAGFGEGDKFEDYASLVAERLANGVDAGEQFARDGAATLTTRDFDGDVWPALATRLRELTNSPAFQKLHEVTRGAKIDADKLSAHLENERFELCEEFDIPAAPVVAHPTSAA